MTKTYLLIHGAWHGGWCWQRLVPLLEAAGYTVLAPDLPGHGDDRTPSAEVTLERYTSRIRELVLAQSEPVILVGHSMGGIAITQAAETCADHVAALVYVCAFLPRSGDSLMSLAAQDQESLVNPSAFDPREDGTLAFKLECSRDAFYGSCTEEAVAFAQARLGVQAVEPLVTPVQTTEAGWGRIPRYYVECTRDRAVPLSLQRAMQQQALCRETSSIDTDHSPFLSAAQQLAEILLRIAAA